jgi:hypothetical protein
MKLLFSFTLYVKTIRSQALQRPVKANSKVAEKAVILNLEMSDWTSLLNFCLV